MQKFVLTLFSVVALLGLVDRSSAQGIGYANRDTNANRLARGLPPHPPTRRSTAKRQAPSHVLSNYILVEDQDNAKPIQYLSCGSNGIMTISINSTYKVVYDNSTGTLSSVQGNNYIGANNITDSGNVVLKEVSKDDNISQTRIWKLDNGRFSATWMDASGNKTHIIPTKYGIMLSGVAENTEVFFYISL